MIPNKYRFSIPILLIILLVLSFPSNIRASGQNENIAGHVELVQGDVQLKRADGTEWESVRKNDIIRVGDIIRASKNSRAVCCLNYNANFAIDEETEVEIIKPLWIRIKEGIVNFFCEDPGKLDVNTKFVNGSVEGTEFYVKADKNRTIITLLNGRVRATNNAGSLLLVSGQSAVAEAGKAPQLRTVARPRDAVQWALYYPSILDYGPEDFQYKDGESWVGNVQKSMEHYRAGNISKSISVLDEIPDNIKDPRFFTYRAGLLLSVGRVDKANIDINKALDLDSGNSHALSLRSIIAVVQNRKEQALELAERAVSMDSKSPVARVALSYSQQAHFDLEEALKSLQEAVSLDPENALTFARLSELWLSLGDMDKSLEFAQKAASLNPNLSRTQTVLGFAYLAQIETEESKKAFEKAIRLDQADPLPRLGIGLAMIREGNLKEGRQKIEIAAALDPNNSLIRSYLGKAYFEEKRGPLDGEQYAIAKELDPMDPTPWFYSAISKQTMNRPVEALHDLQKSIELNDNRSVYRSKLMLDEDMAARSASLGRIYQDLGFEQLALVEGWKSVNTDPGDYSAHRFLSDSYAALPRHEIARVSELLQSQLLQPININPVQPSLAESNQYIPEGVGPSDPSFNEFNPLFNRNCLALQAGGILGSNDTWGSEIAQSGVWGKASYSIGGFKYETDGFRENNNLEQNIYNVFVQVSLTHKTSVLAEFRSMDKEEGDLPLRFDTSNGLNYSSNLRKERETQSFRFGFRHSISQNSDIIGHLTHIDIKENGGDIFPFTNMAFSVKEKGYMGEVQSLFRTKLLHITGGAGFFDTDQEESIKISLNAFPITLFQSSTKPEIRHENLYLYTNIFYPKNIIWTIGGSADFFDNEVVKRDQFNPKFGISWTPNSKTTLRAAVFRTLKRTLTSNQTIEPTQVTGFNQFFDDFNGTSSWRYGLALDQKFSKSISGGIELSERKSEVPYIDATLGGIITESDWEENVVRSYYYWAYKTWLTMSGEYSYERYERERSMVGVEQVLNLDTHRIPLGISLFHPSGFSANLNMTYVDQDGEFGNTTDGFVMGDDQFWVVDVLIKYRLSKRYGLITLGVKNLFDENFNYQEMGMTTHQTIYPEAFFFGRITISL